MTEWPLFIAFNIGVLAILAIDLGVFNRTAHAPSVKEAAAWSSVWISLSLGFAGFIYWKMGSQPALEFLTVDDPLDKQYAPVHAVTFNPGGILARIAGTPSAQVNSLHGQGVARLGRGLKVEAVAPDGLVEAFRHEGPGFLLGVQWHPEWRVTENPFYLGIFQAFGDACRARAAQRNH